MKNKTNAALWSFYFGGVGAGKFYLGQTGLGWVYLLFCWTLIPFFINTFELIVLLSMSIANPR